MLTEIRKDKIKLIKEPIKRMSYKGSGSAREVVRMIVLVLGLKIHEDEYDISFDDGNLLFENFNRIGDLRGIIEKLQGGE